MATGNEIRVNLFADIANFGSNLAKASNQLQRFGDFAEAAARKVEKAMKKAGTELTLRVTAPLVALAAASIKAADKGGDFADALERITLQARNALAPLGNALMKAFEAFRPEIETAIKFVNGLAEAFAALDPAAQRQIIIWAGIAAAAGPALIALAGLAGVAKVASGVFAQGAGIVGDYAKSVALSGRAFDYARDRFVLFKTALLAFSVGQYLFDEFKPVQQVAGLIVHGFDVTWSTIVAAAKLAAEDIAYVFRSSITAVEVVVGSFADRVASAFDLATQALPDALSVLKDQTASLAATFRGVSANLFSDAESVEAAHAKRFDEIVQEAVKARSDSFDVLAKDLRDIENEFGAQLRRHPDEGSLVSYFKFGTGELKDFLAQFATELNPVLKDLTGIDFGAGLKDGLDTLRSMFAEAQKLGKLPDATTPRDQKNLDEARKRLEGLYAEASKVRLDILPEEDFARQLGHLKELRDTFPTIIDDQVWAKQVDKIKDKFVELLPAMERVGRKLRDVIQAASQDASDQLASFLVTGERNVGAFLQSLAQRAISSAANTALFEPLFKAFGGLVAGAFAGAPTVAAGTADHVPDPYSTSTTPEPPTQSVSLFKPNALGSAFALGRMVAFARGGVVTSPTMFGMAGGTGLMGEAGPEAVMPLTRVGGHLGVRATGGDVTVNIIDQRSGGTRPEVSSSQGSDGRRQIQILIRDQVKAGVDGGDFDQSLGRSFGLKRKGAVR